MNSRQDKAVVPASQQKPTKPYLESADVVIIGNGIAGLTAAVELRRYEPDKRIVIITDQIHPTINTPALKQFAIGKLTREQLLAYPPGTERTERIHVVTARVEEIHAQSKYVTLTGKRGFGYGDLLIATGSTPMGLPENTPGRSFDGVLTLHRLQNYLDLRRRLGEVSDAVVIGGGVHAIETVMGLAYWGIHVHWLIRSETFMGRMIDETGSEMILERIRKAGVSVYTKTEVAGVVGRVGSVAGVITNQQKMIPCQMVLSCTGTQAELSLADHCTLPMRHKKGIIVDDQLRTSVPHVFAAGDVAALKNPQTGVYEPRALWYAAVNQGRIAGAMLAGRDQLARQPFGVPWHATHLGELSMLTVGEPMLDNNQVETLTDKSSEGYRRLTISGNRLVGYLSLGPNPPDSLAIKRIVDEGISIRSVLKPLLKGQFDAREYVSGQRSRLAQGMLTGQMPVAQLAQPPVVPVNDQLTPLPSTQLPPELLKVMSLPGIVNEPQRTDIRQAPARVRPDTETRQAPARVTPDTETRPARVTPDTEKRQPAARVNVDAEKEQTVLYEEISSFTGSLPSFQKSGRQISPPRGRFIDERPAAKNSEETPSFIVNQPAEEDLFSEDVSPFSGNLPAVPKQETTRKPLFDPTAVSPSSTGDDWPQQPGKSRGLLAYAAQNSQDRQDPHEDDETIPSTKQPSRSLWSYTSPQKAIRVEKGR